MLNALHLRQKLRTALLKSGITGEIRAHVAKTNLESLKRLIKGDPYVTFGIQAVHDSVTLKEFSYPRMVEIMATALGTSAERFQQPGPSYIDPQLTATRLAHMLELIDEVSAHRGLVVIGTSHPGSLLSYYQRLAAYVQERGGRVYRSPELLKVGDWRWIDDIGGVHILTDEGNLLHTHEGAGFDKLLAQLPETPALVLADHGYAGAAINRGLKTVALHDVDDPGIALADYLGCDMLAIPMNDNQLNLPTLKALEAVLAAHLNPGHD